MSQAKRQSQLLELIRQNGYLTIDELVRHFQVTPQTVRRDLNQMARAGLVDRHHGGAGAVSSVQNTEYNTRKIQNLPNKRRIARGLARAVPDHSSLFINIGTTNEAVAEALLDHRGLKVVTNNLHVAAMLSRKEDFTVIIAGGEVRTRDGGIVGEATRDFVHQFKLDFGIIGISGIDSDGTLLDFDYQEVRIAQAIMENSRSVFLAADHSKYGRNAMVRLGNLVQCTGFFTDEAPAPALQTLLRDEEVALHVC